MLFNWIIRIDRFPPLSTECERDLEIFKHVIYSTTYSASLSIWHFIKTFSSSSKTLFQFLALVVVVFELSITIKFQVTMRKFLVLAFAVKFRLDKFAEQNLLRNENDNDYHNFQSFYSRKLNEKKSIHDIPSRCANSKFHPQKNNLKWWLEWEAKVGCHECFLQL